MTTTIAQNAEPDWVASAITNTYGPRCPEYAVGCACCSTWKAYDDLRNRATDIAAAERRGMERAAEIAEGLPVTMMSVYSRGPNSPPGVHIRAATSSDAASAIRARIAELEQENTNV